MTRRTPVWTLIPGSRLDADYPENRGLIAYRNVRSSGAVTHRVEPQCDGLALMFRRDLVGLFASAIGNGWQGSSLRAWWITYVIRRAILTPRIASSEDVTFA